MGRGRVRKTRCRLKNPKTPFIQTSGHDASVSSRARPRHRVWHHPCPFRRQESRVGEDKERGGWVLFCCRSCSRSQACCWPWMQGIHGLARSTDSAKDTWAPHRKDAVDDKRPNSRCYYLLLPRSSCEATSTLHYLAQIPRSPSGAAGVAMRSLPGQMESDGSGSDLASGTHHFSQMALAYKGLS